MLSVPSHLDSKELYNFKSRARLRHETMSDTFRHGKEKMKLAFEAVTVTVQYQMDNGEGEIYSACINVIQMEKYENLKMQGHRRCWHRRLINIEARQVEDPIREGKNAIGHRSNIVG
eukprot:scaffold99283_cov37-Attheya_sp.AAC.2